MYSFYIERLKHTIHLWLVWSSISDILQEAQVLAKPNLDGGRKSSSSSQKSLVDKDFAKPNNRQQVTWDCYFLIRI